MAIGTKRNAIDFAILVELLFPRLFINDVNSIGKRISLAAHDIRQMFVRFLIADYEFLDALMKCHCSSLSFTAITEIGF